MARKLSTRKRPSRDKYALKEEVKTDTGIFNEQAMKYLSKFFNKGIISKLGFVIARGKEADLYVAEAGGADSVKGVKYVILKFFRVATSSFLTMTDYVLGDPRFSRIAKGKHAIIVTWCRKEYGNLEIAKRARVYAPKPYMFNGSILAMSFIGDSYGVPAPQLKYAKLDKPEATLDAILAQVRSLYKCELVHADLSEYNILVKNSKPYFIDFGQAVVIRHPNAMMFLRRDIGNVLRYFAKRYGIERDAAKEFARVIGPKSS